MTWSKRVQQITQKFFDEFLPFHKNYTEEDLNGFMRENLPEVLQYNGILEALTHKSFAHESKTDLPNNERLEFLGDSVLQLIVTEELMKRLGDQPEGKLSKLRSHIVNENSLSMIGQHLCLDHYILLGRGELKAQGQKKPSILANTLEAILGAMYLEKGIECCREFILNQLNALEAKENKEFFSVNSIEDFDAKSRLQELSQKIFGKLPNYQSRELEDGQFEVSCSINGELMGKKIGPSKKQLMQDIARDIIQKQKLGNHNSEEQKNVIN